jgi:hypothetical protein
VVASVVVSRRVSSSVVVFRQWLQLL